MILNMDDLAYALSKENIQNVNITYNPTEEFLLNDSRKFSWLCYIYLTCILESHHIDIDCYLDIKPCFFVYYDLVWENGWPEMEEKIRRDVFYKQWYEDVSRYPI